jgi:hypothetical protein
VRARLGDNHQRSTIGSAHAHGLCVQTPGFSRHYLVLRMILATSACQRRSAHPTDRGRKNGESRPGSDLTLSCRTARSNSPFSAMRGRRSLHQPRVAKPPLSATEFSLSRYVAPE